MTSKYLFQLIQTRISDGHTLTNISGLRLENPISCVLASITKIHDCCLEGSVFESQNLIDSETQSAIKTL